MVAEVPKPKITGVENVLGILASLQASAGWALIVKILNDNIAYLEKGIIDKIDPITKIELSEADIELFRIKRSLNMDLRDTPQNYSNEIVRSGEVPEEFDPYYQSNDDIIKDREKPVGDDK